MLSLEDAPGSHHPAIPRGGRRPKRISQPSVSAFFTGPEELKDAAHSAALLAQLKSFYDAQLLCDVTIEVLMPGDGPGSGRQFSCNRNMLAAACPYFRSMFTGDMCESQQASVTIHDMDAESFEMLVDYCYTGRVSLSEANVQRLYAASDMLQLEYVREACASFLARRLDLTNCSAILKFADAFNNHQLRSQAQYFIAHNFKQLSRMGTIQEETLADLTLPQLLAVLSLDCLDIESEKPVCHVAVQWLEAAPKERGPSASEILKCVRWAHFTAEDQDYLKGLLNKPVVRMYCLDIIEGALQMRYGDMLCKSLVSNLSSSSSSNSSSSNSSNSSSSNSSNSSTSSNSSSSSNSSNNNSISSVAPVEENPPPRLGMCAKKMVIFFGHPRDPFLCYDPYSGDIYTMPSPVINLTHKTITSLAVCVSPDHDIYLATQPRKDLWVYKPAQNTWHQLADHLLCREGMDMAYLSGYIYIVGGRDPLTGIKLKEVECYCIQRNQWALVAPVPHSFYSFELIVVQNYLYAVNRKRMLCYDPSHNTWLNCASLKQNDFQEACVFKDEIYCICDIPVMKVYNPARGEWRRINNIPLDLETHNYQIVNHDQKLLLITSTTPEWKKNHVTIYEYNMREDQWINIGAMLGLLQFDSGFVCLCARVYPSYLKPGQSFITEEDDERSESSTEWDLDGFSDLDYESESSSSFSDEEFWVQVAPQQNALEQQGYF